MTGVFCSNEVTLGGPLEDQAMIQSLVFLTPSFYPSETGEKLGTELKIDHTCEGASIKSQ